MSKFSVAIRNEKRLIGKKKGRPPMKYLSELLGGIIRQRCPEKRALTQ
jgi:hypothetical protein